MQRRLSNRGITAILLAAVMVFGLWGPAAARAEAIEGYTLTYNGNGASSGNAPASATTEDGQVTIAGQSASPLEKTGYAFAGWNEAADGTGAFYAPGDKLTLTEDTTVYAYWAPRLEAAEAELIGSASISYGEVKLGAADSGVKFSDLAEASYFVLRYYGETSGKLTLLVNDEYRQDIEITGYDESLDVVVRTSIQNGDSISIVRQSSDVEVYISYIGIPAHAAAESIVIDPSELSLVVYRTATRTALVTPSYATDKSVVWSSSDPAVATVDAAGKVRALSKGTTTIMATAQEDSSVFATSEVTVTIPPAGMPYAVQISGSPQYSSDYFFARMSDGTVLGMGNNQYNQLGDGTTANSLEEPVLVLTAEDTPLTEIKEIATGAYHGLALDQDGQVWSWGGSSSGANGEVDYQNRPFAKKISAFIDEEVEITDIAAGSMHSLALDSDGQVWAWGSNSSKQLGTGGATSHVPQLVQAEDGPLAGITSISAGNYYSLALDEEGRIWAWGNGEVLNQNNATTNWEFAWPLSEETDVFHSISAGSRHFLAIDAEGGVRLWGILDDILVGSKNTYYYTYPFYNERLSLGDGTVNATAVYAHKYTYSSSYITLADGSNWCWGHCLDENSVNAYVLEKAAPRLRPELQGLTSIAELNARMLGLSNDGTIWTWDVKQTEYGVRVTTPQQSAVTDVQLSDGGRGYFGVALKSDGRVYTWGNNGQGQVGNHSTAYLVNYNVANPAVVVDADNQPIEDIITIDAGLNNTLAINAAGEVWGWGNNGSNQLGADEGSKTFINYARKIPDLTDIIAVSAGGNHSLALKSDGTLLAWGLNGDGQLNGIKGEGQPKIVTPVEVTFPDEKNDVKAISAGDYYSVAVKGDEGSLWFWGSSLSAGVHQVVYKNEDNEELPLLGITAVGSAPYYPSIALKDDGTVWTWTSTGIATQIQTTGGGPLSDIEQIAVGYGHYLALDSNQEVWVWGSNYYGEMGNGTYDSTASVTVHSNAEKVAGLSEVKHVGAGSYTSLITKQDGTLWTFGLKTDGALAQLTGLIISQVTAFKGKEVPEEGTPGGGTPGGNPPSGGTVVPETAPVTSTDGNITVPVGRAGEAKLGDELVLAIPAGAASQEIKITIEKLLDTASLASQGEVFASPVYELLKNFSGNFEKPVTLKFAFDTSKIKVGQRAAIFYYDETNKVWVEVGGQVNGDTITAEVDHFTKFTVLAVDVKVEEPELPSFSDIAGHWGEANIKQAVQQGIVSGYPDGTFKPNATVTRAEFTVMLANALKLDGEDASLSFTDELKIGAWAKSAIAKSVAAGIVSGYSDGTFRPEANITRTELAVMVARTYGATPSSDTATGFADDSDIPSWARASIAKVKELGIVSGQGGNRFAPSANATRAEAVTIILNLLNAK